MEPRQASSATGICEAGGNDSYVRTDRNMSKGMKDFKKVAFKTKYLLRKMEGAKMNSWAEPFLACTGIGLMIGIPIWAYWAQKAKIEIEKEKTKQLEFQLKLKEITKDGK